MFLLKILEKESLESKIEIEGQGSILEEIIRSKKQVIFYFRPFK